MAEKSSTFNNTITTQYLLQTPKISQNLKQIQHQLSTCFYKAMEGKLFLDAKVEHEKDLMLVRYSKRKDRIFTGLSDGTLRTLDTVTLQFLNSFAEPEFQENPAAITGIGLSPFTDYYIAVYTDGWLRFWDTKIAARGLVESCVRKVHQEGQILGCATSPLIKCMVTCGDDSKLTLYDIETGRMLRIFDGSFKPEISDGHRSRVFTARFHPREENELVSGGWDQTVQIWDLRKKTSARYISGPYICGDGLDFDPDGTKLLTCSFKKMKNILLWDYRAGKLLKDLTKDTSKIYCGKFLNSDLILTSSTDPSTVRVTSTYNDETICMYRSNLPGMYSADGEAVLLQDGKTNHIDIIANAGNYLLKMKATHSAPSVARNRSIQR